jgi:hypothetical protein
MVPYTAEQQSTLNMMMRRRVILLGIIYSLIRHNLTNVNVSNDTLSKRGN